MWPLKPIGRLSILTNLCIVLKIILYYFSILLFILLHIRMLYVIRLIQFYNQNNLPTDMKQVAILAIHIFEPRVFQRYINLRWCKQKQVTLVCKSIFTVGFLWSLIPPIQCNNFKLSLNFHYKVDLASPTLPTASAQNLLVEL